MKMLSCKRIARMIALYAAGDLVGARRREVAAHLATCEGCRRLAEEFSLSRNLLAQAFTLPEFGADFYSGIRGSVLGEIARDRRVSKPALFRRRWLYATAFAALVIAFGLMLQHFGSIKRQATRDLAIAPGGTDHRPLGQEKRTNSSTSHATELPQPPRNMPRLPGSSMTRANKVMALAYTRKQSGQSKPVEDLDGSAAAQVEPGDRKQIGQATPLTSITSAVAIEPAPSSGESPLSPSPRSASQLSRIEIQTANPNIRIIWLARREPEETNHAQDQNQNGNRD